MSQEQPNLKDIRDLIDGLAITTGKNFAEVKTNLERLKTTVEAGFGEVNARLDGIERKLDHHETRIEVLEAKVGP
jgi:tetrahydromethanopterin S-methyltransferase subunit G